MECLEMMDCLFEDKDFGLGDDFFEDEAFSFLSDPFGLEESADLKSDCMWSDGGGGFGPGRKREASLTLSDLFEAREGGDEDAEKDASALLAAFPPFFLESCPGPDPARHAEEKRPAPPARVRRLARRNLPDVEPGRSLLRAGRPRPDRLDHSYVAPRPLGAPPAGLLTPSDTSEDDESAASALVRSVASLLRDREAPPAQTVKFRFRSRPPPTPAEPRTTKRAEPSDASPRRRGASDAPGDARARLRDAQNASERRRRTDLRANFDLLRSAVPDLAAGASKLTVLKEAALFCGRLRAERGRLDGSCRREEVRRAALEKKLRRLKARRRTPPPSARGSGKTLCSP